MLKEKPEKIKSNKQTSLSFLHIQKEYISFYLSKHPIQKEYISYKTQY